MVRTLCDGAVAASWRFDDGALMPLAEQFIAPTVH
jgi:hypothetical protein